MLQAFIRETSYFLMDLHQINVFAMPQRPIGLDQNLSQEKRLRDETCYSRKKNTGAFLTHWLIEYKVLFFAQYRKHLIAHCLFLCIVLSIF